MKFEKKVNWILLQVIDEIDGTLGEGRVQDWKCEEDCKMISSAVASRQGRRIPPGEQEMASIAGAVVILRRPSGVAEWQSVAAQIVGMVHGRPECVPSRPYKLSCVLRSQLVSNREVSPLVVRPERYCVLA